jgi:hypothetical protein
MPPSVLDVYNAPALTLLGLARLVIAVGRRPACGGLGG